MEPGEGALDDPAIASKAGAVLGVAAGDLRPDPSLAELTPVLVVTAVGADPVGPAITGSSGSTSSHNSSDTTHGATATGTPPSLTTDADGVRRQGTGPFI